MNNQKQGPGCIGTLIALGVFIFGGAFLVYIAPSVQPDSTKKLPDGRTQLQQIIQHWHGPALPKLKVPTGEVFTVSTSTKG